MVAYQTITVKRAVAYRRKQSRFAAESGLFGHQVGSQKPRIGFGVTPRFALKQDMGDAVEHSLRPRNRIATPSDVDGSRRGQLAATAADRGDHRLDAQVPSERKGPVARMTVEVDPRAPRDLSAVTRLCQDVTQPGHIPAASKHQSCTFHVFSRLSLAGEITGWG